MIKPIVAHTTWDAFSWPRINAKLTGKWRRPPKAQLPVEEGASAELAAKKQRVRDGKCRNGEGHDSPVVGQRLCRSCMDKYKGRK